MKKLGRRIAALCLMMMVWGLALGHAQAGDPGRAFWKTAEQKCFGDLSCMVRTVREAPAPGPHRGWRDAGELVAALKQAGRFRHLGLSDAEGETLVREVLKTMAPSGDTAASQTAAAPQATPQVLPAPNFDYRAPAEFETLRAVLLRWPFDWPDLQEAYARMMEVFARSQVTAVVWVNSPFQRQMASDYLDSHGVPTDHIRWVVVPTNTVWIRDYGPQVIRALDDTAWGVVDFHYYDSRRLDDQTPRVVAWGATVPLVDRQRQQTVYTEGGNLNHDGLGCVVYSERTYKRNPSLTPAEVDQRIRSALQATKSLVPKAPVLDGTGHVDMFMKIVAPDTVLVGRYDPEQVDYAILEEAAALFSSETNGRGDPWRVLRIVQPDVTYTQFVVPVVRTYTNSLVVNDSVIVPVYDIPEDQEALGVYEELFPDKTIVPINAEEIIPAGGAWHCVTMEMAVPGQ